MSYLFSIVIPTCNRPNDLAACLDRLSPSVQSFDGSLYEIIVTDDGRQDCAKDLICSRYPDVKWTAGPARGPASNRNHGASLASGKWLIFIDDDCIPAPRLIRAYQAQTLKQDSSPVVLEGPTLRIGQPKSLLWEAPHNPNGAACISANFAIRLIDFEDSGKFDERYPSAAVEDTEFFDRFYLSGGRKEFVANATVHHPLRHIGSAKSLARKWEGKVIYALDQGASPSIVVVRLPWHVLRVIQSRFRRQAICIDNVRAAARFAGELALVLCSTWGWVQKWSRQPRSPFWTEHVKRCGPPRKFGF
jgi:glycosyltransferase involved in cell wall biosynthesis